MAKEAQDARNARAKKVALEDALSMDKRLYVGEPKATPRPLRLTPRGVEAGFYLKLLAEGELMPPSSKRSGEPLPTSCCGANHPRRTRRQGSGSGSLGDRANNLTRLREALLEYSYVIHASSSTEAEAYRLFQALNDRGTPLTEADLLRTKTLEVLRGYDMARARAATAWDVIVKSRDPRRFLQAFFAMKVGKRPQSKGLHRQYEKQAWIGAKPKDSPAADKIADFAAELAADSERYAKLVDGLWPYTDAKANPWDQDRLKRLIKFTGQLSTLPLLLALSHRGKIEFVEAVNFLDLFALRYVICRGHASRIADAYIEQANAFRATPKYSVQQLKDYLEPIGREEAADTTLKTQFGRLDYQPGARTSLIKHLLADTRRLRGLVQDGCGRGPIPESSQGVEHVAGGCRPHLSADSKGREPRPARDGEGPDRQPSLSRVEREPIHQERPVQDEAGKDLFKTGQATLTRYLSDKTKYPQWDKTRYEKRRAELLRRCLAVLKI